MEQDAALETPKDAGKGQSGIVRRWNLELKLSDKHEKDWRNLSEEVLKRYKGEYSRSDGKRTKDTFNILWSNTETLLPSIYNSTPSPDVRRRFRDVDPLGKIVAEILERSLSFSLDTYDFDRTIRDACLDYLLPGRGTVRVRYVPSFGKEPLVQDGKKVTSEDGEPVYPLAYESVLCEHVQWDDFRIGPGKRWKDVPWIAFRHYMDRTELVDQFGEKIGNAVELNDPADEETKNEEDSDIKGIYKTAEVWEIWDRQEKEVVFICPSFKEKPLKTQKDPLRLENFFPIPKPMYSVEQTDSMVPIPEFTLYETLADELDKATSRINKIMKGLKLRGVYDSTISEFRRLFESDDNELIPAENVVSLMEKGGLEKSIWMLPIDKPAQVLVQLYQYREVLKNAIYEITGISDIIRGATNASETATAQTLKSQWGTLRLQNRQKEVARFCRDILRLKAEIIAEKFQPQTLSLMTGLEFPTQAQKQAVHSQMQLASVMGKKPDPEAQVLLMKPSWEEISKVLKNDALRVYRVDVETDSTVAAQLGQDQKNVTELITAMGQFMQQMAPAVQSGFMPIDVVKTLLLSILRRFKLGNDVEDALGTMKQPQQGMPPEVQKQIEDAKKQYEQGMAQVQQGQQMVANEQEALTAEKNQLELGKIQLKNDQALLKLKEEVASMSIDSASEKKKGEIEMAEKDISVAVEGLKQLQSEIQESQKELESEAGENEKKEVELSKMVMEALKTMQESQKETLSVITEALSAPKTKTVDLIGPSGRKYTGKVTENG